MTRLGITGFCWGGRIVWLYAAHSKQLKAGVAWYGRLVGDPSELLPKHPDRCRRRSEGARARVCTRARIRAFRSRASSRCATALKAAKVPAEIVVYPDAQHGFHADYRPSYKEDDAKDGWNRLLAWFKKHGAA